MKYKDPKELIGLEIMENGKPYVITGIGAITEEHITLNIEAFKSFKNEFCYWLN